MIIRNLNPWPAPAPRSPPLPIIHCIWWHDPIIILILVYGWNPMLNTCILKWILLTAFSAYHNFFSMFSLFSSWKWKCPSIICTRLNLYLDIKNWNRRQIKGLCDKPTLESIESFILSVWKLGSITYWRRGPQMIKNSCVLPRFLKQKFLLSLVEA